MDECLEILGKDFFKFCGILKQDWYNLKSCSHLGGGTQ